MVFYKEKRINSLFLTQELANQNGFKITGMMTQKLKNTTRSFNVRFSANGKNKYITLLNKM